MKVSKELAEILREACEEVDQWPEWKRSLDPLGEASAEQGVQKPEGGSGK